MRVVRITMHVSWMFVFSLLLLCEACHAQSCTLADIALVIDSSGSIIKESDNWLRLKEFTKNLVDHFDITSNRVRLGVITYGSTANIEFYLNSFSRKDGVLAEIDSMQFMGTKTHTALGIQYMRSAIFQTANGDRDYVPNVGIVFTDAQSNVNPQDVKIQAELAKSEGVYMVALGGGSEISLDELRDIATVEESIFTADSFESLVGKIPDIINLICPPDPVQPTKACPKIADLALILDESRSITFDGQDNWDQGVLGFAVSIAEGFPIAEDLTRVGVVTFGDVAEVRIQLNDFEDEESLVSALGRLEHRGGATNIADGLKKVRTQLFVENLGDRKIVTNIAILVTDGRSTIDADLVRQEAKKARENGIEIFTVAIGMDIDENELDLIASPPIATHAFQVDEIRDLQKTVAGLIERACEGLNIPETTTISPSTSSVSSSLAPSTFASTTPSGPSTQTSLSIGPEVTPAPGASTNPSAGTTPTLPLGPTTSPTAVTSDVAGPTAPSTGPVGPTTTATRPVGPTSTSDPVGPTTQATGPVGPTTTATSPAGPTSTSGPVGPTTTATGPVGPTSTVTGPVGPTSTSGPMGPTTPATGSVGPTSTVTGPVGPTSTSGPVGPTTPATSPVGPTITATSPAGPTSTSGPVGPTTPATSSVGPISTATDPVGPTSTSGPVGTTTPGTGPVGPNITATSPAGPTSTSGPVGPTKPATGPVGPTTTATGPVGPTSTSGPVTGPAKPATTPVGPSTLPTDASSAVPDTNSTDECRDEMLDLVIAFDCSGSIGDNNFPRLMDFVRSLIKSLPIGPNAVYISVVTFSDEPTVNFYLNEHPSQKEALKAIDDIEYRRGSTNTASALKMIREMVLSEENGNRDVVHNLLLLITDGESDNATDTMREANLLKDLGVHIMTFGVGNWYKEQELETIASYPYQDNFIHVESFKDLSDYVVIIKDAVCDNVNECASNPCNSIGECFNNINHFYCACPPEVGGKTCDTACLHPADVIFALDASGSIGRDDFQLMTEFVTLAVLSLDLSNRETEDQGVRVGLLTYGDEPLLHFNLNEHLGSDSSLLSALHVPYSRGTTNTADAIQFVRERMFTEAVGDRPSVPNFLIVITDGRSDSPNSTWHQAMQIREEGVTVLSVGISSATDQKDLAGMVSAPVVNNTVLVDGYDSLNDGLRAWLTESICNNVNDCSSNPCQNGGTCTDKSNGYTCSPCPSGFTGFNCERVTAKDIDLVFMLDSSGSIHQERFPYLQFFVSDMINMMDIGSDSTRIGLISWSDDAKVHFYLDDFDVRENLIESVMRLPFQGGKTNTAAALRLLHERMFALENGDRPDADNIAIVVTDGNSNVNPEDTFTEAIKVKTDNIRVIVVSVGELFVNELEIEGIASLPTEENIIHVNSYETLESIAAELIASTSNSFDECASSPCQNGGKCFDSYGFYQCDCFDNYAGLNCERKCTRRMDLVFILDLSGSMQEAQKLVVDFAQQVTHGLVIENDLVRVGVITYTNVVQERFYLATHIGQKWDIINYMNFYYEGGLTNTAGALSAAQNQFTATNGDRSGVQDIIVLVTDGYANVDKESTDNPAKVLKNMGVEIYTVGLGETPNDYILDMLASVPESEHSFSLLGFDQVEKIADELLDKLCE